MLSLPDLTQMVCMIATSIDNAMVIGTKKKWYTVVIPNCHLARVSAVMARIYYPVS